MTVSWEGFKENLWALLMAQYIFHSPENDLNDKAIILSNSSPNLRLEVGFPPVTRTTHKGFDARMCVFRIQIQQI